MKTLRLPPRVFLNKDTCVQKKLPLIATIGLLCLQFAHSVAGAPAEEQSNTKLQWSSLEFVASKLLITVRSSVELDYKTSTEAGEQLVVVPRGEMIVPQSSRDVLSMRITTRLLGRESAIKLWMLGGDGQALQRERLDSGRKNRYKVYRYLKDGVHALRRSPDKGEKELPHPRWSKERESRYPYADGGADRVVVDSSAILYLLSGEALRQPGDSLTVQVFSNKTVIPVRISVEDVAEIRALVELQIDGNTAEETRGREALQLSIEPLAGPDVEQEDFELLGLSGALTVMLDREYRVPLSIMGKADALGQVTVRLKRAALVSRPGAG
jgi:hypothetical protein